MRNARNPFLSINTEPYHQFNKVILNHYSFRKETDRTEQSRSKKAIEPTSSIQSVLSSLRTHFSSFPLYAGITLETAIVLPLFLFMMFIMMYPLKIMEAERKLQNTMETVGKRLASAEYIQSVGEGFLSEDGKYTDLIMSAADGAEEAGSLAVILAAAAGGPFRDLMFSSDTAVFSEAEEADSDMFYAKLEYEPELPFLGYDLNAGRKSLVVNRRAWVGSEGGRGRSKYGDEIEGEEAEEDRTVYLGKTATVYHVDPKCHYLSNVLETADAAAVSGMRNESGGKYHACPSCKPGNSGTVFYFANGSAYHSSPDCKAITAYARAVPLSEVEGMRVCSYCGKSHS